jgi:hypothetical protein
LLGCLLGLSVEDEILEQKLQSTPVWFRVRTVATGASNRSYPDDEIVVDSNGQVWIAYMIANKTACGGNGTDRPQVIHSVGTNYASWTFSQFRDWITRYYEIDTSQRDKGGAEGIFTDDRLRDSLLGWIAFRTLERLSGIDR